MKRVTGKKAELIELELEKANPGMGIRIFFGSPDARFNPCYWAIAYCKDGSSCPGTYGHVINSSKTMKGLLNDEGLSGFFV